MHPHMPLTSPVGHFIRRNITRGNERLAYVVNRKVILTPEERYDYYSDISTDSVSDSEHEAPTYVVRRPLKPGSRRPPCNLGRPFINMNIPLEKLQRSQKLVVSLKAGDVSIGCVPTVVTVDAVEETVDRLTLVLANESMALPIAYQIYQEDDFATETSSCLDYAVFLIPRLMPLPILLDVRYEMQNVPAPERLDFLKHTCEQFITDEMVSVKISATSIHNGLLKHKMAHLYASKTLQVANKMIPLTGVAAEARSGKKLELLKGNRCIASFRTDEAENWASAINDLISGVSKPLIDAYLLTFASHSNTETLSQRIIAAITSPNVSFTVSLLNYDDLPMPMICSIFEILVAKQRLAFFIRTILFAEVSITQFDELFITESRYAKAFLSLLRGIANEWIAEVSCEMKIYNIISAFASIPPKALFMLRTLILVASIRVPQDSHVMIPFFNCICALTERKQEQKRMIRLLKSKEQLNNRSVLLLSPFLEAILKTYPAITPSRVDFSVTDQIYQFLLAHIRSVLADFEKISSIADPLLYSYEQSLRFQLRDLL